MISNIDHIIQVFFNNCGCILLWIKGTEKIMYVKDNIKCSADIAIWLSLEQMSDAIKNIQIIGTFLLKAILVHMSMQYDNDTWLKYSFIFIH